MVDVPSTKTSMERDLLRSRLAAAAGGGGGATSSSFPEAATLLGGSDAAAPSVLFLDVDGVLHPLVGRGTFDPTCMAEVITWCPAPPPLPPPSAATRISAPK